MTQRDELKDYMEGAAYGGGGNSPGGALGRAQYYDDLAKRRAGSGHAPGDVAIFLVSAVFAGWLFLHLRSLGWVEERAGLAAFAGLSGAGWFLKRTRLGRALLKLIALSVVIGGGYVLFHLYTGAD